MNIERIQQMKQDRERGILLSRSSIDELIEYALSMHQPSNAVQSDIPCAGLNCGTTTAQHSKECVAQHAAAVAGGRFVSADENALLEQNVAAWRKERARLDDLIATATGEAQPAETVDTEYFSDMTSEWARLIIKVAQDGGPNKSASWPELEKFREEVISHIDAHTAAVSAKAVEQLEAQNADLRQALSNALSAAPSAQVEVPPLKFHVMPSGIGGRFYYTAEQLKGVGDARYHQGLAAGLQKAAEIVQGIPSENEDGDAALNRANAAILRALNKPEGK